MIYLNGVQTDTCSSLSELLEKYRYTPDRIVVEINERIIKKSDYDNTFIQDGDKIEVVSFVGGG